MYIFFEGGLGKMASLRKQSGQRVFFSRSSPQLILQFTERVQWQLILQFTEGVQWFYYSKNCFSKDPEGVQHFPGGGGGSKC